MGVWSLVGPSGTEVSLAGLGVTVRSEAGAGMPPLKDIALEQATAAVQALLEANGNAHAGNLHRVAGTGTMAV